MVECVELEAKRIVASMRVVCGLGLLEAEAVFTADTIATLQGRGGASMLAMELCASKVRWVCATWSQVAVEHIKLKTGPVNEPPAAVVECLAVVAFFGASTGGLPVDTSVSFLYVHTYSCRDHTSSCVYVLVQ